MSTRVFVRLYDGTTQHETDDEVLELPPPPLKWKDAITAMVAAVGKQGEYEDGVTTPKARLFLLPTEATGIAAELNARSLRFGVRENDRFVICLRAKITSSPVNDRLPRELQSLPLPPVAPAVPRRNPASLPSLMGKARAMSHRLKHGRAPRGGMGGSAPSGGLMSSGKKGSKRYRSISGKMAAIKSLGDKGLISNDDRGHLKDLLLNNDSPQLQEALDKYNNTGDFQAVKDLLLKEIQNPSSKRNTGDWLSESFVNDIALNFNTTPPASKSEPMPVQNVNNTGRFSTAPAVLTPSANAYVYQPNQSTPMNATSYPQSSPMAMNHYSTPTNLVTPTGGSMSTSSGYTTGMSMSNGYPPTTIMTQQYHQPQASPTNMYAGAPPQINLPLRDRATYMRRGYESSPVHNMMGMNPPAVSPAASAHMGMNGYGMQQGYAMNQGSYPANVIYAGDQSQYTMNTYMSGANGTYNPYQQQPQYAMNRYGYGSMQPDMGYNFYAAGYGFGKAQLRAGPGGKWTTAPPMPSYPPPCSKEEKKEKIAKWLKKRENRNWSNKPSYPVRHSIAKNRKRGEDGRFITKARLAEMAAEEAAAAAAGNSDEPQKASPPSSTAGEAPISMVSQTTMPQATSVP
ncbi:CCT domain [Phytophthora cactorum]|nr:CCT domain [Phytophthora cactorum]